jgi:hypothetical protein
MTPTEFDFTLTMPGDSRLLGAIRQLTAHAAGYAQLNAQAAEQLAGHVEQATEVVIAASRAQTAQVEYRFTADAEALVVVFSCDVAPSSPHPPSSANGAVTIEWTSHGPRHVCRIRRLLSA